MIGNKVLKCNKLLHVFVAIWKCVSQGYGIAKIFLSVLLHSNHVFCCATRFALAIPSKWHKSLSRLFISFKKPQGTEEEKKVSPPPIKIPPFPRNITISSPTQKIQAELSAKCHWLACFEHRGHGRGKVVFRMGNIS